MLLSLDCINQLTFLRHLHLRLCGGSERVYPPSPNHSEPTAGTVYRGSGLQILVIVAYLTWRNVRPIHCDAEVWTSPPFSSGPADARAALWPSRPARCPRSRAGSQTGFHR